MPEAAMAESCGVGLMIAYSDKVYRKRRVEKNHVKTFLTYCTHQYSLCK